MGKRLREAWCEECVAVSLIGGTQVVAALMGVHRRTVRNWCTTGRVHAP